MIIISHRGNLNGPEPEFENSPHRIDECIDLGLDVEIDVWLIDDTFYLGHDEPQYQIDFDFLYNRKLNIWIHCKNIQTLSFFCEFPEFNFNYFWHQNDDYVITSNEYIWTYPKDTYETFFNSQIILDFSANVDYNYYKEKKIHGLCCDYINFKEI